MLADDSFREKLERVVLAHITGCKGLLEVDRLSGGASQETYRLVVKTAGGQQRLALRRTPGGEYAEITPQHPGLDVEALLMQSALAVGVPEPEVYYVLQREDDLGDGFLMQWLDGEALGARIVRSPEFETIRPKLAYECGKVLAQIHSIDLDATGLRERLWEIPPAEFVEQTWERYRLLDTPQPMIDYVACWLMENLPEQYETALVHNDFRNGNFLLSPNGIVAVLDWEVAHVGDPMRDLGWICTNSWRFGSSDPVGGFGQYEDLFKGYEDESGKAVDPDHVKFWEVFGSFWWSVGCL
ncbi:MAG: phosphotransferase family protein, partial [Gammaproteobacteria bacterium]|nr:phosphotransferase family protein [Gammaproteobacteria bacterium]